MIERQIQSKVGDGYLHLGDMQKSPYELGQRLVLMSPVELEDITKKAKAQAVLDLKTGIAEVREAVYLITHSYPILWPMGATDEWVFGFVDGNVSGGLWCAGHDIDATIRDHDPLVAAHQFLAAVQAAVQAAAAPCPCDDALWVTRRTDLNGPAWRVINQDTQCVRYADPGDPCPFGCGEDMPAKPVEAMKHAEVEEETLAILKDREGTRGKGQVILSSGIHRAFRVIGRNGSYDTPAEGGSILNARRALLEKLREEESA